jgi:hypothetical protein
MEINPIVTHIQGVSAHYDEAVSVYRIDAANPAPANPTLR